MILWSLRSFRRASYEICHLPKKQNYSSINLIFHKKIAFLLRTYLCTHENISKKTGCYREFSSAQTRGDKICELCLCLWEHNCIFFLPFFPKKFLLENFRCVCWRKNLTSKLCSKNPKSTFFRIKMELRKSFFPWKTDHKTINDDFFQQYGRTFFYKKSRKNLFLV